MKRFLAFLISLLTLLCLFALSASAYDVAPKFTESFFPSGKIDPPTDLYYQINRDEEGRAYEVYLWLTQPDDVFALFTEYENLDCDAFTAKYGGMLDRAVMQVDCKVDNGDWHYNADWDKCEYTHEGQPYDLALRQIIHARTEEQSYCEGTPLIDTAYFTENAGYLAPVSFTEGENVYLDLTNHSLTLRLRYVLTVVNDDLTEEQLAANGGENYSFLYSDWSEEVTIGKDATQKELVKPEKIDPITISELTFVNSNSDEGGVYSTDWKVFVVFPESVGAAARYYSIVEDKWDSLCSVLQYRVKTGEEWGEWQETSWGNADWLCGGWRSFTTDGVSKDDTIEFRAYVRNDAEEGKDSPFSASLFCNAGEPQPDDPTTESPEESATVTPEPTETYGNAKKKCKVCGICPVQPLGICLFIWLAIVLAVVVIIVVIAVSKKKKSKDGEKK